MAELKPPNIGNELPSPHPKDRWDKAQIIGTVASTVAVPLSIVIVGGLIQTSLKGEELRVQTLEIAANVLQSEPTRQTTALRQWATQVMNTHSDIPLSEPAIRELQNTPLPSQAVTSQGNEDRLKFQDGTVYSTFWLVRSRSGQVTLDGRPWDELDVVSVSRDSAEVRLGSEQKTMYVGAPVQVDEFCYLGLLEANPDHEEALFVLECVS